jgi:F-type H+-transporting ATPase subunit beta
MEYRSSAQVAAMYLPVADASPTALGEMTAELDAVVTFAGELGRRRLYPAIDPMRSTSRLLDPDVVGTEHVETASQVRNLLQGEHSELVAVERMRNFLTQPFFVAEPFTQLRGQYVSIGATIDGCKALLDGDGIDITPDALYMIGPLA